MARLTDEKRRVKDVLELNRLREEIKALYPAQQALRDIRREANTASDKMTNLRNGWIIQRCTEGLK